MLRKCKHISLPSQKEVHFWDWHYHKGMDWYIRQFEKDKAAKYYGEITPDYIVLSPATIAEIQRCFPDLKIIFIARDLVDRAWSAMIMELRDQNLGLNPGEFADGVIQSDERRTKRTKSNVSSAAQLRRMQQLTLPSSQPDSYFMERLQHETHKSRSDYTTSLKNWYRHFPDESILLIDYRELQTDPRGVLRMIVSHIGVKDDEANQYLENLEEVEIRQKVNVSANINQTSLTANGAAGKSQIDSSESLSNRSLLRKRIQEYLSPYVATFNELLREKGYAWSINDYKEKC